MYVALRMVHAFYTNRCRCCTCMHDALPAFSNTLKHTIYTIAHTTYTIARTVRAMHYHTP